MFQSFFVLSSLPIVNLTGVTNYSMYNSKKLIVCTALKLERQLNSIRVCALCCALVGRLHSAVQWLLSSCVKVALKCACLQAPTTLQYTQCSHQQLGLCAMPAFSYFLLHRVYFSLLLLPTIFLSNSPTISLLLFPSILFFCQKEISLNNILCVQSNKTKAQKLKATSSKIHRPPTSFKLLIMPCFCQKLEQQKGLEEKFELLSDLSNVVKNSITSENCAINQCINLLRK